MKNIFDMKHVKGTTAICLLNKATGEYCGRIVANWSDNPAGTVCTAQVHLFSNAPVKCEPMPYKNKKGDYISTLGTAGGYGYDKLSQAIYGSLKKQGIEKLIKVEPASGNQRQAFEDAGFIFIEVC